MKFGSNGFNSFEAKVNKIVNRIDMLEAKTMHLFSNRWIVVVLYVRVYKHILKTKLVINVPLT